MSTDLEKRLEELEKRVETLENKPNNKKFTKPTIQDVHGYMREKLRGTDGFVQSQANLWYDHYTSNGWKVGKVAMKDWKATVRKWVSNIQNNTFNADNTRNFGTKPVPKTNVSKGGFGNL